jgi:glucokinase
MSGNFLEKQETVVGVDIGGTNTIFGIVDFNNNIISEHSIKTYPERGVDDFFERLALNINETYKKLKPGNVLSGIGIAAPGANHLKGIIQSPANLKWGNVNVYEIMEKYFDVPIALINDAKAAALGEQEFGSAIGINNFIVITLGTGLGTGIVLDGQILHGENGFAGEIGHSIVEKNGRQCNCGRRGCLETYVSASGIKRTVFNLLSSCNEKSEFRYLNFETVTSKHISELALQNDPIALKAFNFTGKIFGRALSNMVTCFDPKVIILYGGLAEAGELLLKPTRKYLENSLLNIYNGKVQILKSKLQNGRSAVLGAGSLVKKTLRKNIAQAI